jgi:hypothetical protein
MVKDATPGNKAYSDAVAAAAGGSEKSVISYLQFFEARLARLEPFMTDQLDQPANKDARQIALTPEKFSAVILLRSDSGDYDILMGSRTKSGYGQTDHAEIADNFHLSAAYASWEIFGGFIMTTADGKRHLNFTPSQLGELKNPEQLTTSVKKYGISTLFSDRVGDDKSILLAENLPDGVTVEDYRKLIIELIGGHTRIQIAQKLGLTGPDYHRFRLTGMLVTKTDER